MYTEEVLNKTYIQTGTIFSFKTIHLKSQQDTRAT